MSDQPRVPAGNPKGGQWSKIGESLLRAASGAGSNAEASVITDLQGNELTPRTLGLDESVEFPKHSDLYNPKAELVDHHTHPWDSPPSSGDLLLAASRPGVKMSVVHTSGSTYEYEILQHDRIWREGRDVVSDIRIKELDRHLDSGQQLDRKEYWRKINTEALNKLQELGMLKWRKL